MNNSANNWLNKKLRAPLRSLLIVPFVLQTVGLVGLVGYLSYQSGEQAVENLANQVINQATNRIKDHLDNFLQSQRQSVDLSHRALSEGNIKSDDFEEMQNFFWQQMKLSPLLNSIGYVNEKGEEIAYRHLFKQDLVKQGSKLDGENLKTNTIILIQVKATKPGQKDYYLVDNRGKARKQIFTLALDDRKAFWYGLGKAARKQSWSPIFVYQVAKSLGISSLVPIYDEAGKFQGVLSNGTTLTQIETFLSGLDFSPSGQTFILERSGELVATSTGETPYLEHTQKPPTRILAIESRDARTRAIASQLQQQWPDLKQIKTHTHLQVTVGGNRLLAEVTPYQDSYGLDWLIVTVIPESDFLGKINANVQRTFLLCIVALMVSLFTGSLTAYWISQPVERLNKAAKQLTSSQFVDLTGSIFVEELNSLTESFTEMADRLQVSFSELATQKAYFANLLEILPVGVAIHLTDGSVNYLNKKAQELLDTPPIFSSTTNQLAETYNIYLAGTDQLCPTEQLPAVRALRGESCHVEDLEVEFSGKRFAMNALATPIFNSDGEVYCALVVFEDISTCKAAEKILLNYNQKLEEDVQRRTLDLEQEIAERKQAEVALQQAEANLRRANLELEKLVNTDGLTQIANRRCFDERLEQEWSRLYRTQQPLSLLLFDVDYFKRYNDYYGHPMGDECLVKIAQTVQKILYRSTDLVARYGGEEFVVILPETDLQGASVVAQRIHNAIKVLAIPHQASPISDLVTISIGISSLIPTSESSSDLLITQADQALYSVKQKGRNQSLIFEQ